MSEAFDGACHCGALRFTVEVDAPVALECNCSICHQKGFLHVIVPRARFTLHQGADALTTYSFNTHTAKHTFCRVCGVQAFYTPRSHPDGVSVSLRSLGAAAFERFSIEPFDGRDWEANVDSIQ